MKHGLLLYRWYHTIQRCMQYQPMAYILPPQHTKQDILASFVVDNYNTLVMD